MELYPEDPFSAGELDLQDVPSSQTLRQRLNMAAKVPSCGRIIYGRISLSTEEAASSLADSIRMRRAGLPYRHRY